MPKGTRPHPSSYMSVAERNAHSAAFSDGASRFMTESNFNKYGIGQIDNTAFVMTKTQADELVSAANGNARAMENALGLPEGFLDNSNLVRVDIPNPHKAGLQIPSGNEAGANSQWLPGGFLPDGKIEGVIDTGRLGAGDFSVSPVNY